MKAIVTTYCFNISIKFEDIQAQFAAASRSYNQ